MIGLFKTIFTLRLSYQLKALSPEETWTMNIESQGFPSVMWNGLFNKEHLTTKTITYTWSPVSQKNGSKLCLPETWTMDVQIWDFPSVNNKWTFQYHLPTKTIISIKISISLRPEQLSLMNGLLTIFIYHAITIYRPETNIPLEGHI